METEESGSDSKTDASPGRSSVIGLIWQTVSQDVPKGNHMKPLTQLAMLAVTLIPVAASAAAPAEAEAPSPAFEGAKSAWHGFDRCDFLMDDPTLTVKPVVNKGTIGVKGQRLPTRPDRSGIGA
jgi:hypothetical protein